MTGEPLRQLRLRPDVRLVRAAGSIYVTSSTGVFRFPAAFLAEDVDGVSSDSLDVDGLTQVVRDALEYRGLATRVDSPLPTNPFYAANSDEAWQLYNPGSGAFAELITHLIRKAGILCSRSRETPQIAHARDACVVPLSSDHVVLRDWTALSTKSGARIVVYSYSPSRLLLATLNPPATACPLCLATRLRANFAWQDIAGLSLEALLGEATEPSWASTSVAAGIVAHHLLLAQVEPSLRGHAQLYEFRFDRPEVARHPLLQIPGCVACCDGRDTVDHTGRVRSWRLDDAWSAPEVARGRMHSAVDPLTGIIGGLSFGDGGTTAGKLTHVNTTGRTTTTWFSPVQAQAAGGSVKVDPLQAEVSALGEALERYACGVYDPAQLVRGTRDEVGDIAVDPRELPLGSTREYEAVKGRLQPYREDLSIEWVEAESLTTGAPRLLPACAVFVPYRFPAPDQRLLRPISTGLGAGGNASEAILSGLFEVIERDAFTILWENRLVVPTLDLEVMEDPRIQQIVARLRDAKVDVFCKNCTTDFGVPAVVITSRQECQNGPLVAHASRAHLDWTTCVLRALEELEQARESIKAWVEERGVPDDNARLRTMEDFLTYYCRADRIEALRFLHDGPIQRPPVTVWSQSTTPALAVQEVIRRVERAGYEAIAADITPIDVAACGIYVIKTIIPGAQPVTFARDFRHLGGRRLYDVPVRLGLRSVPISEDDLNPFPMP